MDALPELINGFLQSGYLFAPMVSFPAIIAYFSRKNGRAINHYIQGNVSNWDTDEENPYLTGSATPVD